MVASAQDLGPTRRRTLQDRCGVYDENKVDKVVLALLHLNTFGDGGSVRAWKGFDLGCTGPTP